MVNMLIAEDDPFLIKIYKYNMDQKNFAVRLATNGAEVIEAMDREQPDILLLDLLMPKVDGFGVLKHIREKKYSFPVIVFSNIGQEFNQNKCRELGVSDYCIKSDMDLPKLMEKVNRLLKTPVA